MAADEREPPRGSKKRRQNRRATRRQFGRDRRSPLTPVPEAASALAIGRGRIGIAVTLVAWGLYSIPTMWREIAGDFSLRTFFEASAYVGVLTLLALSASMYLLARHGALVRSTRHRRAPRGLLDDAMAARSDRTLTTLVPSYREEERVVFQTLLSAALQEYPNKRVVLLIDDPPIPDSDHARKLLARARALPARVEKLLRRPAAEFAAAHDEFMAAPGPTTSHVSACAGSYRRAARYIADMRRTYDVADGAERFMRDEVLGTLERDFEQAAEALELAEEQGARLDAEVLAALYRRLKWTFASEITSFERKRYANLSHEPNKAMNLNSYISLGAVVVASGAAAPSAPGSSLVVVAPVVVVVDEAAGSVVVVAGGVVVVDALVSLGAVVDAGTVVDDGAVVAGPVVGVAEGSVVPGAAVVVAGAAVVVVAGLAASVLAPASPALRPGMNRGAMAIVRSATATKSETRRCARRGDVSPPRRQCCRPITCSPGVNKFTSPIGRAHNGCEASPDRPTLLRSSARRGHGHGHHGVLPGDQNRRFGHSLDRATRLVDQPGPGQVQGPGSPDSGTQRPSQVGGERRHPHRR